MISLRARIAKRVMRGLSGSRNYDVARVVQLRRNFERNLAFLVSGTKRGVRERVIAGVPVEVIEPTGAVKRNVVYLHGGGFVMGSPKSHRRHIKLVARLCSARVYAIDYRLAPESPYPAALEDIQRVWEQLLADKLADPKHTAFMGDSAGGNLALASLLRFRDQHVAMPSCLVMLSPGLDLTLGGESYQTKRSIDPLLNLAKLEFFVNAYVGNTSRRDPAVSPVFADLHGLPPMLVHVGTDELLLSDAQTIIAHAKRDHVDATLFVGEGMWHVWHFFAHYLPEAKQAMQAIALFVVKHT